MRVMRGFFLFFLIALAFSIPMRGDHLFPHFPRNHFFPPSRTLFFFRPDLYVRTYFVPTPLIYAPPIHSHPDNPRIYLLAVTGPIDAQVVRANTSDLIFQVRPGKALVYINEMLIGSARDFATRRDRYTIMAGQHDLRIEARGYEPYETRMDIAADRTLHLEIDLEPLRQGSE